MPKEPKITALYERLSRDDDLAGESPTKRNIWKITPKRTASRTSAILQMMAFQV